MITEKEARERARLLREFYKNLTIYGVVNVALIFIWLLMGAGAFWPIWVMVGWGVGLLLSAVNLGVVPQIQEFLPFFAPEWEDEQVKRMLKEESSQKEAKVYTSKEVTLKPVKKASSPKKKK